MNHTLHLEEWLKVLILEVLGANGHSKNTILALSLPHLKYGMHMFSLGNITFISRLSVFLESRNGERECNCFVLTFFWGYSDFKLG